jgi:hypothetical protein
MGLSSVLQQAQQGDPQAIATLLTQALAPQAVSAQARLRQGGLEVALTAMTVPDQAFCLRVLRQGLMRLQVPGLHTVRVMGLRLGEPFPEWMGVFSLTPPPVTPVPPPSVSNYPPSPSQSHGNGHAHYSPALTRDPELPTELLAEELLRRYQQGQRNFSGVQLTQADLSWAILDGANLTQADLGCANLQRCNLVGANLTGANLHGADLTEANLVRANLTGVNLRDATLNSTQMPDGSIKYDKRYCP